MSCAGQRLVGLGRGFLPVLPLLVNISQDQQRQLDLQMSSFVPTVSDPSDFAHCSEPRLVEFDSLLRCHICKEYQTAPVLTTCGHSYCSVCIRKYLIHTAKCPICSKEIREANLQRNVLLEQVVICFKTLRDDLLEKLTVESKVDDRQRRGSCEVIEIDDNVEVDDELEIVSETKKRRNVGQGGLESLFKRKKTPPKVGPLGTCPICAKQFPIRVLESEHIDLCLNTPLLEQDKDSIVPKESEHSYQKLTKLDFSSLSNTTLKQKLAKLELPTNGNRNQLESRYNEYLILWNANCDSIVPKDPKVLRRQLAQWESSLKFRKDDHDRQLDKKGWSDLIKQARNSKMKTREEQDDAQVESIDIMSTNEEDDSNLITSAQPQNCSIQASTQESTDHERVFAD